MRHTLIDERIDVIRATGHDENHLAVLNILLKNLPLGGDESTLDLHLLSDGATHSPLNGRLADSEGGQVVVATVIDSFLIDERDDGRIEMNAISALGVDS